jgi:hypothetical protein
VLIKVGLCWADAIRNQIQPTAYNVGLSLPSRKFNVNPISSFRIEPYGKTGTDSPLSSFFFFFLHFVQTTYKIDTRCITIFMWTILKTVRTATCFKYDDIL